jgi:hypothetical protein
MIICVLGDKWDTYQNWPISIKDVQEISARCILGGTSMYA